MLATLAIVAVSTALQAPPDFTAVLQSMHSEYRKQKKLVEEWRMKQDGQEPVLFAKRWIDGQRFRTIMYQDGTPIMDTAYDGVTHSMIMHMAKSYSIEKILNPDIKRPFSIRELEGHNHDDSDFRLGFNGGYDIVLFLRPWPTVRSIARTTARDVPSKVVDCEWPRPDGRKMDVKLVFQPDSWLLKSFTLAGKDQEGKETSFSLMANISRPKAISESAFRPSAAEYAGYSKVGG
jgi:hypothetical protein